jgi:Fe-S-cluster containining protein
MAAKMVKRFSRQIKKIEAKENNGEYGSWRKQFCRKYRELLVRSRNNTHHSLVETLAPKGDKITCRKGCTYCCYHYVTVSIGHGIVISDHLLKRKELLKQFIENYEKWHRRGYPISDSIDRTRIQAFSSSMPIDDVIAATRPLSAGYLDTNIPCPFLVDKKCFIYDVRPFQCSGHYSVSPPNWCASTTKQDPVIHQLIPNDEDLSEMLLLADPRLTLYELTLPTMIYKLISKGSSSIMTEIVQLKFEQN